MKPPATVRKIGLGQLVAFARNLEAVIASRSAAGVELVVVMDEHVRAECHLCQNRISGLDLLRLANAGKPEEIGEERLARLMRGYCAQPSCDSQFCRFEFQPFENVDWNAIASEAELIKPTLDSDVEARLQQRRAERRARWWRAGLRLVAGLAVLAALLLYRQWQSGGRIPFLREPRQFKGDPAEIGGILDPDVARQMQPDK